MRHLIDALRRRVRGMRAPGTDWRGFGATVVLASLASATLTAAVPIQTPLDVDELVQYRLTTAVFMQFEVASRSIAAASRADPALAEDPLFTREIMLSDDAAAAAAALEARLLARPALVRALRAAKMSAREYTKFALTVLAAHVAHGFVKAGVLRGVPKGAAAANVAFVQAHEQEIAALLADLGIQS